ncbi:MAG: DUF421 domain-containing protein [Peptococcaceae bacterium]|jgi:uncharacterized membrane protein YcaP (DUF421 family)|nr:DUF421 domain-containing protein [Peptococcaceae bacterium]
MPLWLNIALRSTGLFVFLLLLTRLPGRRQASRLTMFDVLTAIVLGGTTGAISLNLLPRLESGLIVLAVWSLFPLSLHFLSLKYKAARDVVQGREMVLVNHGKVLEDSLLQARLTAEDLLSRLRTKNVFNIADVEFASLETDGELSVLLKKDRAPVTAKTLGVATGQESVPQTVILDGAIMDEPLTALGLNRRWLRTELAKTGVAPENVFIGQVDHTGQVYLDLFDDSVAVSTPKTRDLLFLTLKKCQADLELYALQTGDPESQRMYGESSLALSQALRELEPLLRR